MKGQIKNWLMQWLVAWVTMVIVWVTYASTVIPNQPLTADLFNEKTVPTNAVMAFAQDICPTGWSEYLPAQWRFIRWIDKTWTNIDPNWQRSIWDIKEDTFKNHTHNRQDDNESEFTYQDDLSSTISKAASQWEVSDRWKWENKTWNSPDWSSETSPKNVALLYCVKN